ncbi:helix-turn-helix domain-containing protein [Lachnospiraceae bacterium SGI.085]
MKLNLKKLKLAMAVKCLSARGLSQKTGINYVTLTPYLNGKREPKPELLGKIAKALEVDPAELID